MSDSADMKAYPPEETSSSAIGVLVEAPVMLTVCRVCNRTRH